MALISKVLHAGEELFSHRVQMPRIQWTPHDRKVMQQIQAAHSPDGSLMVDENALLTMAQDILQHANSTTLLELLLMEEREDLVQDLNHDPKIVSQVLEDKAHHQGIPEELAFTIHKIGCEISCNCSGEGDTKLITLAVFNTLVKYSWDAKLVLALSAFAVSYGEFCLLSHVHATNPLANYVVQLKPLPNIRERVPLISSLLKVVIDVAKCIIDLMDLPLQYISRDSPPLSDALNHIPYAVYWAIKSIVACSSESIGLINMGHGYVTSNAEARKKLTDLAQILKNIHVHLTSHLALCHKYIDDQINNQIFYNIKRLMDSSHNDNMEILTELIHTEDNLPLFNGVNKKRVSLNILKGQTVVLFISYLNISDEEIKEITQQVGKQGRQFEILWLPIIDKPLESNEIKHEILRKASLMPWYSLNYSFILQPAVIRFIKEVWRFEKKPLMVVLNGHGNIVCSNAYHKFMVWGSAAYPFDDHRVETLWEEATWSLEFLVDGIVSDKEQWLKEERFICFYGGDDLDWIRKFTSTMKEVVKGQGIFLELIYVGKKQAETIIKESLSKCWDDPLQIRRFWARLESIWYSKMQHGKTIANDTVLKDVMMLLSSDGSGRGWTMIGHGSKDLIAVNGKMIMDCLLQFKKLKINITSQNFFYTMSNVVKEVISIKPIDIVHKHCNHIILSTNIGVAQENVVCVDCNRPMEKYVMYKCCIE